MEEFEYIIYQRNGPIALIMFNRPEVMNALNPTLIEEFLEAVEIAASEDSIEVVLVTGAGEAWSAGVDLNALNDGITNGQFDATQMLEDGNAVMELIQTMPKPAIAVVNGHCFTGALELMMCFDIIIAAEEAKIGDTHCKWGMIPKWGMSQRLSQLVGPLKARELSFTSTPINGKEAARIGLVNMAVPLEELDDKVSEIVKQILGNSSQTIASMKHLYLAGEQATLKDGLAAEQEYDVGITDRTEFLKDFVKNK